MVGTKRTDKDRMDFMERQRFTRWVGYGDERQHTAMPVFAGKSFRDAIDYAMDMDAYWRAKESA